MMGSLCSPDRQPQVMDTDNRSHSRVTSRAKISFEESKSTSKSASESNSKSNSDGTDVSSITNTNTNTNTNDENINNNDNNNNNSSNGLIPVPMAITQSYSDNLDDIDDDITNSLNIKQNTNNNNTSNNKKSGFVIKITPPDTSTDDNINTDNNTDDDAIDTPPPPKIKQKIDPTIDGQLSWKKIADFSALLPKDVKLKLWNGVFKTDNDYNMHEIKKISKILRTFVMLQLTREYKRQNEPVPVALKSKLPGACKVPSRFISNFLKKNENIIDTAFLTIYQQLCDRFDTNDPNKIAKYAKKTKIIQDNYAQLTKDTLQREFNKEDFLKNSWLQYVLLAFKIKLDSDAAKKNKT